MVKTEKIVTYTCDLCEQVKRQDEMSRVNVDVTPYARPQEGLSDTVMRAADVCADCIDPLTVTRLLGPVLVTAG